MNHISLLAILYLYAAELKRIKLKSKKQNKKRHKNYLMKQMMLHYKALLEHPEESFVLIHQHFQ